MQRPGRPATETESDLVVAIFRTIFIIIVALSPRFVPQARQSPHLQISLVLAGLYNIVLLIAYWRGLRFPYQRHTTVAIDLLLITLWIFYSGPLGTHFFPLYYITVIVAGFWFGVAGTLASAGVAGLLYLTAVYSLAEQTHSGQLLPTALYEQIPLLFLVAIVVSYIADVQARERRGWYEARIFLARHQERVRLAQKVYDLLQPGPLPALAGLDLGVRFRPAGHAVAGDYYEVIPFSSELIGLAAADVAGKLEPGLVKLPLFKSALRVLARISNSPAELLAELNRLLYPELQPEMFVSLSYGLVDLQQMTFSCAVAGQEPPFLIHGSEREVIEIPAYGMVLGVLPDIFYDQSTIALTPGDTLVFFTDGVTEAQSHDGEDFGSARLRQAALAADARDLSAQGLADRLMELVLNFSAPYGRKDDATILVAKIPLPIHPGEQR